MTAPRAVSVTLLLTLIAPVVLRAGEADPTMSRQTSTVQARPSPYLVKQDGLLRDTALRGALLDKKNAESAPAEKEKTGATVALGSAMLNGAFLTSVRQAGGGTPASMTALSYLPTELGRRDAKAVPFLQFFALDSAAAPPADVVRLQPNRKQGARRSKDTSSGSGGVTLRRSIDLALQRHPEILTANAQVNRSKANIKLAEAAWRPKLGFDAGGGAATQSSGTGSFGVVAEQLIYDFGRTPGEISVARSGSAEASARVQIAKEAVAGEVALAYLGVSRSASILGATDDYIATLEQIMEMIKLRSEAGLSDKSDLILSQVRLDSVRSERVASETALANARSSLAILTGREIKTVAAPSSDLKGVGKKLKLTDINKHPEIIAAEQGAKTAALQRTVAAASAYPRIGVQGSYRYDPFESETRGSLMLTVRGDVPVDGAVQARVAAAADAEQAAQFHVDSIRLVARNQFVNAQEGEKGAEARIKILDGQIVQAESSRDIYLEQYQLGKRALFELLDAEQQVYLARLARISAENDRWESIARKAMAIGGLTASLGL